MEDPRVELREAGGHDCSLFESQRDSSELHYRRLFESAKDGILILCHATGTIIEANPFLSELLACPTEAFCGKELWEIGLFKDRSASEAAVREMQANGCVRFAHLPVKSWAGREVEVEFVGNTYQEGPHRVMQCNIRDITERGRLERSTLAQATALADLHQRKDEFLAMLSHELRTPLAPIANAVQILARQPGESAIQAQAREVIGRQVGQLKHLVDDLLEVSRITSGKMQLRKSVICLRTIVARAVEATRPLIESRRHALAVSLPAEPVWLHADAARLEQVMVNLLTNAAKYTEDEGSLCLTVSREGDTAVVRVRDTGVGMAPDLLPRIFDLFTQAERSLDRAEGGLGIGLCLVRRLLDLHGGTVEASSVIGQGSEFVVHLPMAASAAPAMPTPTGATTETAAGNSCRVLVVDDSADTAESLAMLLTGSGHRVRVAYDGAAALHEVATRVPDVVLMDIGLPGRNGLEIAKLIRAQPALAGIVLVAMTGYGQDSDRQRSREAGFNYHLVKPADLDDLRMILDSVAAAVPVRPRREGVDARI
jgi:PAS domain S-box-containing protein